MGDMIAKRAAAARGRLTGAGGNNGAVANMLANRAKQRGSRGSRGGPGSPPPLGGGGRGKLLAELKRKRGNPANRAKMMADLNKKLKSRTPPPSASNKEDTDGGSDEQEESPDETAGATDAGAGSSDDSAGSGSDAGGDEGGGAPGGVDFRKAEIDETFRREPCKRCFSIKVRYPPGSPEQAAAVKYCEAKRAQTCKPKGPNEADGGAGGAGGGAGDTDAASPNEVDNASLAGRKDGAKEEGAAGKSRRGGGQRTGGLADSGAGSQHPSSSSSSSSSSVNGLNHKRGGSWKLCSSTGLCSRGRG